MISNLKGSGWKEYKDKQSVCGLDLPAGLKESSKLAEPIFTPATKAEEGHDEDISREEILAQGMVEKEDYLQMDRRWRSRQPLEQS